MTTTAPHDSGTPAKKKRNRGVMTAQDKAALAGFEYLPGKARVRLPVVVVVSGCSAATIWRRIKEGRFPPQHKDGRNSFWLVGEVRAHLEGQA